MIYNFFVIIMYFQISPVIYKPAEKYVHHFLAYLCTNLNERHEFSSEDCSSDTFEIRTCTQTGKLFAGWAVGGTVC